MAFRATAIAALALAGAITATAGPVEKRAKSPYPFNQIVAYGDELSDNGFGSYAHGMTGSPANVYGNMTWTNGPVAVTYLAGNLSVPLIDLAFGGSDGGGKGGATLDNAYTQSDAGSPSLVDQINMYKANGYPNIKTSMQFIWVGQNDLSKHTDAFWTGDLQNTYFAGNISAKLAASVQTLLSAGAPYVLVANIYPKQIAPVTAMALCHTDANCVKNWGQVIQQANTAIQNAMTQFGDKVIYFDSFASVTNLVANRAKYGFDRPIGNICDGQGDANWNDCMNPRNGNATRYVWMNFIQPTTRAHSYIAKDMKAAVDKHFGVAGTY